MRADQLLRQLDPQERIRRLKKAADAGATALEKHTDFPRLHLQAMEAQEALLKTEGPQLPSPPLPSPERLDIAIRILDIWASAYVQLVVDLADQKSFMAFLRGLERHAWETYRGMAHIEPLPGNKERETISARCIHWQKESYRRLIPANATDTSNRASLNIRKAYSVEIRAWMTKQGIPSVELAAKRLGVGYGTLKSIMTDKGTPRYSQDTLRTVLEKITGE